MRQRPIFAVLLAGCLLVALVAPATIAAFQTEQPGALPDLPNKPEPQSSVFNGCPPEGTGGDRTLNRLKNREDVADRWYPVSFSAIAELPWPRSVDKRSRSRWSSANRREVAEHEGTPVSVECYIAKIRAQKDEACNCHSKDPAMRDFHLWLTKEPSEDRSGSVVAEVTPRLRAKHPKWTANAFNRLAQKHTHVRISGWLLLDQEHPEEVSRSRGTLWEIHPIVDVETEAPGGKWLRLDKGD